MDWNLLRISKTYKMRELCGCLKKVELLPSTVPWAWSDQEKQSLKSIPLSPLPFRGGMLGGSRSKSGTSVGREAAQLQRCSCVT